MHSTHRAFRLTRATATRLSFVLGLGIAVAAPWSVAPALCAQQSGVRTDLAIQSDVLKALATYPDISIEKITATTSNGVVTLGGVASSDTAKNQAQVVAATVDGVRSVVNNVRVSASAAPDSSARQDQQQEPVQQAQSNVPDQQEQQPAYSQQSQPQPGVNGNWGKAGPPPDIQNGQIPQPPQGNEAQSSQQPQGQQQANQYPMQDPGQDDGAPAQPQQQQQQQPAYPQGPAYGAPSGQYPQQGNPEQGYPQRAYPGPNRAYAAPHLPSEPVTLPANTLFTVRTSEPLDSRTLRDGDSFQVVLAQDLYSGPYLAIPRGALLQGNVVGVKKPGALRGSAGFALQIVSLNMTGQSYPVATDTFATDTRGKGGYTTANTVGGAAIGALIGAVAGGGPGAAIGAVAGGGVGLGASAATNGPRDIMPPETLLTFHLRAPLTVSPVSYAEVQSLQASVTPVRAARPRPPYGYAYPGPYGYPPPPPPPPYYYPYRYYYWR